MTATVYRTSRRRETGFCRHSSLWRVTTDVRPGLLSSSGPPLLPHGSYAQRAVVARARLGLRVLGSRKPLPSRARSRGDRENYE